MFSLFILNDGFLNGLSSNVLNILSIIAIICGIFVIISKNPVVSVLFLIGLFLSIASYLIILGISFLGLSYLLVYVGAVSILFLFILMLINVRVSELLTNNSNSIPLSMIIIIVFNTTFGILGYDFLYLLGSKNNLSIEKNKYLGHDITNKLENIGNDIVFVTSNTWDGALSETTHITAIGNILYTSYPIFLLITSIILLLSMVGAIVITIKQ